MGKRLVGVRSRRRIGRALERGAGGGGGGLRAGVVVVEDLDLEFPELGGLRRRRRVVLRLLRPAGLAVHLVASPVTAGVAGSWISSREEFLLQWGKRVLHIRPSHRP